MKSMGPWKMVTAVRREVQVEKALNLLSVEQIFKSDKMIK